ncbi:MAG: hypothetical protein AAF387_18735 [Pseudomonadota bacterium]
MDANGRVLEVHAPFDGAATATTAYTYDQAGRRTGESFSQSNADRLATYDADGNLCASEDVVGGAVERWVDYTYDGRGRLLSQQATTASGDHPSAAAYDYDAVGNLVGVSDDGGTWSYTSACVHRLQSQVQYVDRLATSFTTTYAWHDTGELASMSYPSVTGFEAGPTTQDWELDPDSSRVLDVTTDVLPVRSNLAFDAADRALHAALGNGADAYASYDLQGRVAERRVDFGGTSRLHYELDWDAASNISRVEDQVDSDYTFDFAYDERNRLLEASSAAMGGYGYTFNAQNLMSLAAGPTATTTRALSYDAQGNLATMTEGSTTLGYAYDDFGNRVTDEGADATFEYDALNRLRSVVDGAGQRTDTTYGYDGRRTESGDKVYLYGLGRLPIAELEVDTTGGQR